MIIKTSLLLQSLMVGMLPSDNSREFSASDEDYFFEPQKLTPIPDPKDYAKMARFIVHNANWTSVAYVSHQPKTSNRALVDIFSVSDGPVEAGQGIPYFYVSRLQAAVADLIDFDNQCSLTMGLQQTPFCKERDWDDEDPRCAHVILTGTFKVVPRDSPEYPRAFNSLMIRHPSFRSLPQNHHFFVAKYDLESITLQDYFGGPVNVPLEEYFSVKDRELGLVPTRRRTHRREPKIIDDIFSNDVLTEEELEKVGYQIIPVSMQ